MSGSDFPHYGPESPGTPVSSGYRSRRAALSAELVRLEKVRVCLERDAAAWAEHQTNLSRRLQQVTGQLDVLYSTIASLGPAAPGHPDCEKSDGLPQGGAQ